MSTLDEHIAQQLAASLKSGELKSAPSWGKPLELGDAFDATPYELRMPFKVLKDAGVVPAEVRLMQRIAELKRRLNAAVDESEAQAVRQLLSEVQQTLALRMESMRRLNGSR